MRGQRTDIDTSKAGILHRIKTKCVVNEQGCWVWNGSVNNKGRPMCSINNKYKLVYKHSYEARYDVILPLYTYLCHRCDNPLCCNPEHVFEGDNQVNQLDYIAKHGEVKNGSNSGPTYVNTGVKRNSTVCPSNIADVDRITWYMTNACIILDNCWIWNKEVGQDGYGRVKYKGQKHMAHRLLWMLANNKTTADLEQLRTNGLVVIHCCPNSTQPNRACCNPAHLTTGSRSENAIDTASYSKAYKYDENVVEWLYLYEIYINDGNKIAHSAVAQGLRNLGLVSHEVSDRYVVDVLRGKSLRHLHEEFFDWTPSW
jgi:hypothetical protein